MSTLLNGIVVRRPTFDDLEAVTQLIIQSDLEDCWASEYTSDELLADWRRPGFELEQDAWVVEQAMPGQTALVVGYGEIRNRDAYSIFAGYGYVHPHYSNLGLGTLLMRLIEQRAREQIHLAPPGRNVILRSRISSADQAALRLLEDEEYHTERSFWLMQIKLAQPPEAPHFPEGIRLQTFSPDGDDYPIFIAFSEAFQDHWGHVEWDYEGWVDNERSAYNFDPSLWFIALDGEQIVGGALCFLRGETGWVKLLAVRQPWRRKGIGLALLRQVFGEFYKRGTRTIGLSVDAQNLTGATQLYLKAGMHVAHEYIVFVKDLL